MSTEHVTAAANYRTGVVKKIRRRIVPFLAVLYIVAFIDRSNVGYAALEMNDALGITAAQFGLIAGLFSIGYFLFEVPSNMLMRKVGARKWIARILFTWGAVAILTGFVQGVTQLAIARTVLGIAEAGFFPCILLYLTYWFPERERARVVAQFMVALPISNVIAGPLSGFILDHVHWLDFASWRWLFIIEGLPAIALAFVTLFYLVDTPAKARWLTTDERTWLISTLEEEQAMKAARHQQAGFWRSLLGWRSLTLAFIYFSKSVAIYTLAFFTPMIIDGLAKHLSNSAVGLLTALPYAVAAVCMVFWAKHSDRTGERRWHLALPLFVAAAGLCTMVLAQHNVVLSLLLLTVIIVATYSCYGPFWSLPSLFMTGSAAAVGLASINSIANLGGFIGPYGFGALKTATGSIYTGLAVVAVLLVVAGVLVVRLRFVRDAEATARAVQKTETKLPRRDTGNNATADPT